MKKIWWKLALIIIPVIAVILIMFPTYRTSQLEKEQQEYFEKAKQATSRADSMAIIEKFRATKGEDLKKSKESSLKLGLDLRGGMYVTLEVDVVKLIQESALSEAVDETFLEVIEKTQKEAKASDESAIAIFMRNFNQIARPRGKSLIAYFDIGDFRDVTEEKIIERLEENADQAIDQASEVIRQRIDKFGVAEPNIQKQGARRIMLELPGVTDEEEMRKLLQTTARLEFHLVRNNAEIVRTFHRIDKRLRDTYERELTRTRPEVPVPDTVAAAETVTADTSAADTVHTAHTEEPDTANPYAGMADEEARKAYAQDHPFTRLFSTYFVPGEDQNVQQVYYITENFPDGDYIFRIMGDSLDKFFEILTRPEIASMIPGELKIAVSAQPDQRLLEQQKIKVFEFWSLKKAPELTGEVITDARANFDPMTNQPIVLMSMNTDGAERWGRITGANIKKRIAIVLDDRVYSAPVVQNKITGGSSQITGMASVEEARLLEIVLKAGALKAPVQIIEERVVGPSLGEDSISSGVIASLIAAGLVMIFMVLYYNKGGLIADFAVLLNITLVISVLTAFGGTLTLPGIAGIILTLGMAVDANILIYERIREELYKGRSTRSAVDEGFGKALSAIIDSNITTFLTGIILFFFGTGPIQGFAMTIMIGIGGTLFTGIMITRAVIEIMLLLGADNLSFGQPKVVAAK